MALVEMTVMLDRWMCAMAGHTPTGAPRLSANSEREPDLEPYVYICRRCRADIQFNRKYPNGWVVTTAEETR